MVFVHGILSNGEACWRHQNGTYWPELLSRHAALGGVGIYEFTYHTGFFSGHYDLGNIVDALKECLHLDGVDQARKIIFVAHSMGGIVVRRYIVQCHDELVERSAELGLFLIASPSLGSSYANWLSPIARFMGHAQGQALVFCQSNAWLNDLNSDFRNVLARRKLVIHGRELVEDRFVILKHFRVLEQVVPPFSGVAYFGDSFKVPLSDHFSIAKPTDDQAIQHRMLCKFIEGIAQQKHNPGNVWECAHGFKACVGASEICIIAGRIEEYPMGPGVVVVLPCDEYFEGQCARDSRTALGVYFNRYCAKEASNFSDLVRQECRKRFGAGKLQQKTMEESGESHGPGRAVFVPDPSKNAAAIVLVSTTTQRAGQGLAARMSYVFDGVQELFELLADRRINEVVMPVLGAGHGGIDPLLALAGLVLALAEATHYGPDRQRRKKITIVVFQRTKHDPPDVASDGIRKVLELVASKT
ncbi:alpha/beta fold hydrolase [Chitinivorax sp. B]|uniref:alpha/beta fold hydrolase n=1 Tax=Chitinivorax sp. B TaxID=2502235 RepID=UPI001485807C|nr:alpha/beta fold hydrolase [Chitinivorax sp. B]